MVSITSALVLSIATLAGAVNGLEVGEYSRPTGDQVSGFLNVDAPSVRSPCPALNALANHGYIPRDGKNLTAELVKEAVMKVYNVGEDLVETLVGPVEPGMTLSDLSKHNLIEHSASLAHADYDSGMDPSALDEKRWESLAARAVDGQLGVKEFAGARKEVEALCKARPDGCDLGLKLGFVAYSESALIMHVMGGKNEQSISIEHLTSFFVDERIPDDYTHPETPVKAINTRVTAALVKATALLPWIK